MKIITPEMYISPGDAAAVQNVKNIPGLKDLTEFISKNSIENYYRITCSSSMLKITGKNSPVIFEMLGRITARFGMENIPEVYLCRSYGYDITALGIEDPLLIVSSSALEDMSPEILETFLVSGIASIKADHGMMNFLILVLNTLGALIPKAALALNYPLGVWKRETYYSCDRARILYCRSMEQTSTLIGFGEAPEEISDITPLEKRMEQAADFLKTSGAGGISKTIKTIGLSRPWNSSRLAELYNWTESGMYETVLKELDDDE